MLIMNMALRVVFIGNVDIIRGSERVVEETNMAQN